jgi:hypothetical protein
MPAWFRDHEDHYRIYEHATQVEERDGNYVVKDAFGNLLGSHPRDEVKEFSTVEPLPRVTE